MVFKFFPLAAGSLSLIIAISDLNKSYEFGYPAAAFALATLFYLGDDVAQDFELAKKMFSYKGDLSNQYHVARKVEPGNSKEMFRAHFDSHLFTMVLPIKIPDATEGGTAGDLIFFPNARKAPSNEISNFIGKAFYKKYASKEGMDSFSLKNQSKIDDFRDYQPLLFIGNTTLHTNYPVSNNCSSYRLTLLAHFFDPSPKYGVGGLLRLIRNR